MNRLPALLAALCLVASPALAQRTPVYQTGKLVPGNALKGVAQGLVQDGGGLLGDANGIGLNPFTITDSKSVGLSINDMATGGAYHGFRLGHDNSGNALISVDSFNGAAQGLLMCSINGSVDPCFGVSPLSTLIMQPATVLGNMGTIPANPDDIAVSDITGGLDPTMAPYNAKCDDATDDTAAFVSWWSDIVTTGKSGLLPAKTCKITAQVYWNLTLAAGKGITIRGAGAQRSILHLTTGSGPALRIGGNLGTYPYVSMTGFAVRCDVGAACVEFGHADYTDILSSATVDMYVENTSTSLSADGVRLNNYINSPYTNLYAKTGGNGNALRLRQASYNNFSGTYTGANYGIYFADSASYGNVFNGINITGVTSPIVSDSATAAQNTWVGGAVSWSGGSGGCGVTINSGQDKFRFLSTAFARTGGLTDPIACGAASSTVMIDDKLFALSGKLTLGGALQTNGTGANVFNFSGSHTYGFPIADATLASLAGTETLTNKTLDNPIINSPALTTPTIDGRVISLGGALTTNGALTVVGAGPNILTLQPNRTYLFPNADGTVVTADGVQTLTNKTINGANINTSWIILPTSCSGAPSGASYWTGAVTGRCP